MWTIAGGIVIAAIILFILPWVFVGLMFLIALPFRAISLLADREPPQQAWRQKPHTEWSKQDWEEYDAYLASIIPTRKP